MKTLKYKTNLNCGSCVAAVTPHLDNDPRIRRWSVDTSSPDKILTVEGEELSSEAVKRHVAKAGFQVLGTVETSAVPHERSSQERSSQERPAVPDAQAGRSFLATYQPLLLILSYLLGIVAIVEWRAGQFDGMRAMENFMGGFFLAFSFFKLLNLRGFVDAYQTYDVLARPFRTYGFVYPFIELGLGVAYLLRWSPLATNLITLVVMLVSIIGVTEALLRKRKIQCACLGTVFNLPMTKVTFIEDALMAGMALGMLIFLLT